MKTQIHQNFIKSSNLIFITVAFGIINFFLSPEVLSNSFTIAVASLTLVFLIGIAVLVRQGYNWVKILLTVVTVLGVIGIPFILKNLSEKPLVGIINIVQTGLQVWAVVLLYQIPKTQENEKVSQPSYSGAIRLGDRVRHKDESKHEKFGFMKVINLKNGFATCQNQEFNNLGIETFHIDELIKQ